jgi:hypothetical protein
MISYKSLVVLAAVAGVGGCSNDGDPPGGDADDIVAGDGDGDTDADGDADLPRCGDDEGGWVSGGVRFRGAVVDDASESREMVVTSSSPEALQLEGDFACDPGGEVLGGVGIHPPLPGGWLPPAGARVLVRAWQDGESGYAEIRSPDGVLLLEGGRLPYWDASVPMRFRVEEDPSAAACTPNPPPHDDRCCCELRASARVILTTDDGEVELAEGESRTVNVEGDEFLAFVARAVNILALPCVDDGTTGLIAGVVLVRTIEVDLPFVDPRLPPTDDCPAETPADGGPCTTRPDLQCDYTWGEGCVDSYECRGCFWDLFASFEPLGADCGIGPPDCRDDGCSEEAVCTDCSCPGDRWRCVWPGDECPACE